MTADHQTHRQPKHKSPPAMRADRTNQYEIFLACAPGIEPTLKNEATACGLPKPRTVAGGVTITGNGPDIWPTVWRANLMLRCASRVLVRIASFPASHLSQLDKRARKLDWAALLASPNTHENPAAIHVEAVCKKSKIYHSGAAAQRIANAAHAATGTPIAKGNPTTKDTSDNAPDTPGIIRIQARLERDICTISLDTSGTLLHKRGTKSAVGKAPLRETLAAAFLHACGYDGTQPVIDPMCGSGTILLEAADMTTGLPAGRHRHFAFENLANFDAEAFTALKQRHTQNAAEPTLPAEETNNTPQFFGFDRDPKAIAASTANANAAGLSPHIQFAKANVSQCAPPECLEGQKGLVLTNPPYGARLGDKNALRALYQSFGATLRERFSGWRVGLITSEPALAKATGLPFQTPPGPPIPHGPLRIRIYQTDPLD